MWRCGATQTVGRLGLSRVVTVVDAIVSTLEGSGVGCRYLRFVMPGRVIFDLRISSGAMGRR